MQGTTVPGTEEVPLNWVSEWISHEWLNVSKFKIGVRE